MSKKTGFCVGLLLAALGLAGGEAGAAEGAYTDLRFVGQAAKAGSGSNLVTYFRNSSDGKSLAWTTCGNSGATSGCYGSGDLEGFGNACAVLSGPGNILYVLDKQSLNAKGELTQTPALFMFRQSITETGDGLVGVSFRLAKKVALPLTGGAEVRCSMAANAQDVVLGTDKSASVAFFDKKAHTVRNEPAGGTAGVRSITANEAGYVVVTSLDDGLAVYDKDSQLQISGGTTAQTFVSNKVNAVELTN
jgi:hypothetical protein